MIINERGNRGKYSNCQGSIWTLHRISILLQIYKLTMCDEHWLFY